MSYIKIENKLNNFINDYQNKFKNEFIYLWTILLLSYHENMDEKIIDNFDNFNKLDNNILKVLEKLIKEYDIFYEDFIIDFFFKMSKKKSKFNLYEHIIKSLMILSSTNNISYKAYFIFFLKKDYHKKNKIDIMNELLTLNNMIIDYLKN